MKNTYTATITFTINIEASSEDVARYVAINAVPKHFDFTTTGVDGTGKGKFKQTESIEVSLDD
jgi:hypothetical protein